MDNITLIKLINATNQALDLAAKISTKNFRNITGFQLKKDKSPVSKIDRQIELKLKSFLTSKFKNSGFWGEEFGQKNIDKDLIWLIDPIDGTKAYVSGYPVFCCLIAVYFKHELVLSVIDTPVLKERWLAYGSEAFYNGTKITIKKNTLDLKNCNLAATTPDMFNAKELAAFINLKKQVKNCRFGGDAYNYGLLALGKIQLVVESDLKHHDIAALLLILKNTQAVVTNWLGEDIEFGYQGAIIAAANKKIHAQAVKILAKAF